MATRGVAATAVGRSAKVCVAVVAGAPAVVVAPLAVVATPGLLAACCCWASSACFCARSSCGPATKNCQPNSTTMLSTMAMIILRLVSFMARGSLGDACGVHFANGGRKVGNEA